MMSFSKKTFTFSICARLIITGLLSNLSIAGISSEKNAENNKFCHRFGNNVRFF